MISAADPRNTKNAYEPVLMHQSVKHVALKGLPLRTIECELMPRNSAWPRFLIWQQLLALTMPNARLSCGVPRRCGSANSSV